MRVHKNNSGFLQPILLDQITPELSLEARMTKLRLLYLGRIMRRQDLLAKTIMLGKGKGNRRSTV